MDTGAEMEQLLTLLAEQLQQQKEECEREKVYRRKKRAGRGVSSTKRTAGRRVSSATTRGMPGRDEVSAGKRNAGGGAQ